FSNDLRSLRIRPVVDEKGSSLSAHEVLRLMKTVCAEVPDRAKECVVVLPAHALRSIFNNHQPVLPCKGADAVHVASDARVMNRDDYPRPAVYDRRGELGIEVQCILLYVREH